MGNLLAFILLIGPLIFVHELGHLLAAKLVDVKVSRFSIGFGPALFRTRFGETEYVIAPIPLGGYVTLLGQNPYEAVPEDESDRSLANKPLWARYLVLAAGPLANFVLPVVVFFFFYLGQSVQSPPVIGTVLDDSAADAAELEPGDRIVAIDDEDIRSWKELQKFVGARPDKELRLQIERDGKQFDRYVTPRKTMVKNALDVAEPRGLLGVYPYFYAPQIGIVDADSPAALGGLQTGDIITSINGEPVGTIEELERLLEVTSDSLIRLTYLRANPVPGPVATFMFLESEHARVVPQKGRADTGMLAANTFIHRVAPGSPAEDAGLQAGDHILEVDGRPVTRWESVANVLVRRPDDPIELRVQGYGDAPRTVTLQQAERTHKTIYKQDVKVVWHGIEPYLSRKSPESEAIRGRFTYAARAAVDETAGMLTMLWTALRQMVTLERGVEELSSVVGIFAFAGTAADQGPEQFLILMAIISLNLGFVNLLPIPILDGGHLLFYTIEAVRRRPLGQRAREIASAIGLVIILLLLLIALRNDVLRYWMD